MLDDVLNNNSNTEFDSNRLKIYLDRNTISKQLDKNTLENKNKSDFHRRICIMP